jgi:hypothetical protein
MVGRRSFFMTSPVLSDCFCDPFGDEPVSRATDIMKPSPPSPLLDVIVELRFRRYVVGLSPSLAASTSRSALPRADDSLCLWPVRGRGDSSVGPSGSTRSFEKALLGITPGGRAGRDFSGTPGACSFSLALAAAAALDFFLLLAIKVS